MTPIDLLRPTLRRRWRTRFKRAPLYQEDREPRVPGQTDQAVSDLPIGMSIVSPTRMWGNPLQSDASTGYVAGSGDVAAGAQLGGPTEAT